MVGSRVLGISTFRATVGQPSALWVTWLPDTSNTERSLRPNAHALNITQHNCAIDRERFELVARDDHKSNAGSTMICAKLLGHAHAARIDIVCVNARYDRSRAVKENLNASRISVAVCAALCSESERLWTLFKKSSPITVIVSRLTIFVRRVKNSSTTPT
jgi:hypothetical protein